MKIPTFLKWAGGKRRLLTQIDPYIPREIETYYEPFLGGGSVFFYIKQKFNPKKCVISDINQDLVNTYIDVRDRPLELINSLKELKKKNTKEFYLKTRKKFNEQKIQGLKRSATFIYLNKTCFNGIYRVNKKGEFNVPYGKYDDPKVCDEDIILSASKLLRNVEIRCQDYRDILLEMKRGDFVYLDPCYDPLKNTSFANYTPERFTIEDREKLKEFMEKANKKNVNLMLSNNDIKEVRDIYRSLGFEILDVEAPRFVNSDPTGRGRIGELLIISKALKMHHLPN